MHLPPLEWWHRHTIDVVALVLGMSANLRVWLDFFAVRDWSFGLLVILAMGCEVVRRIVDAARSDRRPQLFTACRRFDLVAALFLMTGPAPITLPAGGILSPSAWWTSLVLPPWLALGSGLAILAATLLVTVNGIQHSRRRPVPRIRDLAHIPDMHVGSLLMRADVRAA